MGSWLGIGAPTIVISRLSTHPFKYASQLSAQFFWQKSRFILCCLNISCIVISRECMNILRLTFNVSLLTFCWNVSNGHRIWSYNCLASVLTSEQRNWSSMSRTMLCRASKPLKFVALSNSTNVLIGSCNKWPVAVCSPDCPKLSRWRFHWLHTPALAPACLAHSACSSLQWFHIARLRSSGLPQVSSVPRYDSSN